MKTRIPSKGGSAARVTLICMLCVTATVVSAQPVVEVLNNHQEISIFASAIEKAGLDSNFSTEGPFTIFAPSNSALKQQEDRLNRESATSLRRFILNHVFTGMATKRQIKAMSRAPSLGGLVLQIEVDEEDNVMVNDVSVVEYNIRASNGVIHIIEGTLE